ncbi:type VI secretion protein IcmF/TssM N-terminal domain-containing protein [Buttiauxella ferragutiae]|uniref:type VI secretion protein IcmF/TssM N-terminal domain-containing protein n=1 Tax=Buttiauxella ferragutiae TaxID=82989 RepID=UPI003525CF43
MFKKLTCFTGWLLVLCLSLVFCFTVGLWQNWSTPQILLFWLLMLLLATLLWSLFQGIKMVSRGQKGRRLLEKYRLSRREYVLLNHWKAGAHIVRSIQRKRNAIPWYLLVGDHCGKSTLLMSSGIPQFCGETDETSASPTRTLHWWFFRNLCLLELSGNFLTGAATFRQAWKKLVVWCMRMPPPAGIIIAISVADLMSNDTGVLHAKARRQREMINPLVRRYKERLPVHIIVTQCDRFPGFSLWVQQLSARQQQSPLGYAWSSPPHIDGQDESTLQSLFAAVKQGLLRVQLSMGRPRQLTAPEYLTLLDFPEAFTRLESPLRYMLASLCEPNAYFSHITLSSVWFSASEPCAENRGRRNSYLVQDLLNGHLNTLNQQQKYPRWYQRPRGKACCTLLLIVSALWLGVSAGLSAGRLQSSIPRMSPSGLAVLLAADERYNTLSLRYLPFLPLFRQQQHQAETLLVQQVQATPHPVQKLSDFQQLVLAAPQDQQRDYILQLADTLLTWKQMQEGATLDTLMQSAPVPEALQQQSYPADQSPLSILAIERWHMQRPEGERWRRSAQQLLISLVNHDPALNWLLAPSAQLPALQATTFWPSLPDTIALSGIWTRQGGTIFDQWAMLIERAAEEKLPVLQQFRDSWSARRQIAWHQYLINVTAALPQAEYTVLTGSQLVALSQNQSPAMMLASRIVNELSDIPGPKTQPWLSTLRQLQLFSLESDASTLLARTTRLNDRLRRSFTAWLQGTRNTPPVNMSSVSQGWGQWRKARNDAVQEALSQGELTPYLTRGLFSPLQGTGGQNPLLALFPALTTLQTHLSPDDNDPGIGAVWLLYQNDARRLLSHAMTQSACWLNTQWKSMVIWPLSKNADQRSYDEQQALSQQALNSFLHGPAGTLLVANKRGLTAGEYAGMSPPLTADFLRFSQQAFNPDDLQEIPLRVSTHDSDQRAALQSKLAILEQQQSAQQKQVWKTTLSSMPATVPGGARIIPTGTQLILSCNDGDQQMTSMNFAEKKVFTWKPGQCSSVTLNVMFPDFTVSYQIDGEDAWPWFVDRFTSGEDLIDSNAFGESASLLKNLGINSILVRYAVTDIQPMEEAWQSWNDLSGQINDLSARISSLDDRIQGQQSGASLVEPLSSLPTNVAQCQ